MCVPSERFKNSSQKSISHSEATLQTFGDVGVFVCKRVYTFSTMCVPTWTLAILLLTRGGEGNQIAEDQQKWLQ